MSPTINSSPVQVDLQGQVKWFDVRKGFGFIVGPEGQDVFVHFSAVDGEGFKTLKDGERVRYDLHQGEKGHYARGVFRVDQPHKDQTADGKLDGTARAGNLPTADIGRQQMRHRNLDGTGSNGNDPDML